MEKCKKHREKGLIRRILGFVINCRRLGGFFGGLKYCYECVDGGSL